MKILLICEAVFPENKGGIERWFQGLGRDFHSRGHEITYFNSSSVNETRDGIRYFASPAGKWSYKKGGVRSKAQAVRFGIDLYKWLRKENFELIYCSSVPIFSIFGVFLGKKRETKVFVEWFEIWNLRYWFRYSGIFAGSVGWLVQLLALQFGKYRVVYTERVHRSLSRMGFLNRNQVVLLPGLCPETKPPTSSGQGTVKHDIYFLGRFVNEKQPLLAINCIEAFLRTGWKGKFWLAGTGPLVPEIKEAIKLKKLETYVELVENPTDEEIEKIARNSFVLLHPSRREGYGLASVEAAYRGVPSLLINYPDNATVDLGISPQLVVNNDEVEEIVKVLRLSWENQRYFESETLDWAEKARQSRSSFRTCSKILEIAQSEN